MTFLNTYKYLKKKQKILKFKPSTLRHSWQIYTSLVLDSQNSKERFIKTNPSRLMRLFNTNRKYINIALYFLAEANLIEIKMGNYRYSTKTGNRKRMYGIYLKQFEPNLKKTQRLEIIKKVG